MVISATEVVQVIREVFGPRDVDVLIIEKKHLSIVRELSLPEPPAHDCRYPEKAPDTRD